MQKYLEHDKDPFILTGERLVERALFMKAVEGKSLYSLNTKIFDEMVRPKVESVAFPRDKFRRMRAQKRAGVAILSGLWLLVPMWIMVLHKTLWTGLATSTVFVFAFGLCIIFYLDDEKDVVASTAAYAAVLVVFVSLNT